MFELGQLHSFTPSLWEGRPKRQRVEGLKVESRPDHENNGSWIYLLSTLSKLLSRRFGAPSRLSALSSLRYLRVLLFKNLLFFSAAITWSRDLIEKFERVRATSTIPRKS